MRCVRGTDTKALTVPSTEISKSHSGVLNIAGAFGIVFLYFMQYPFCISNWTEVHPEPTLFAAVENGNNMMLGCLNSAEVPV